MAAPLCVKDKRKARAAAAAAAAAATAAGAGTAPGRPAANGEKCGGACRRENGHMSAAAGGEGDTGGTPTSCGGSGALSLSSPCRPARIVIERSEIIRLASQYTPCAGCSAAVKGLLQWPIEELRLVNAVVEEGGWEAGYGATAAGGGGRGGGSRGKGGGDGRHGSNGARSGAHGEGTCGHGCSHNPPEPPVHSCAHAAYGAPADLPSALCLREAYHTDRARLDQVGGGVGRRHVIRTAVRYAVQVVLSCSKLERIGCLPLRVGVLPLGMWLVHHIPPIDISPQLRS